MVTLKQPQEHVNSILHLIDIITHAVGSTLMSQPDRSPDKKIDSYVQTNHFSSDFPVYTADLAAKYCAVIEMKIQ